MGKDLKGRELGQGFTQRKEGRYQAAYTDTFGNRKYLYDNKLTILRQKFRTALAENEKLQGQVREVFTLDDWFTQWIELFKNGVSDSTKRIHRTYYTSRVSPVLGNKTLMEITTMDIARLLKSIRDEGYAESTCEKVKKLLSQMYRCAIDNKYALENPTIGVPLPSYDKTASVVALSQKQQRLLLEYSEGRFYNNAYVVQCNTGLRTGELVGLTRNDVDLEHRIISVNKTLMYKRSSTGCYYAFHKPKTATSERRIPINDECYRAIEDQFKIKLELEQRFGSRMDEFVDLLFTTTRNAPLNASAYNSSLSKVEKAIRNDGKDIIHLYGHILRHTFATRCYEAGIKPKTIQSYLGHSSLQMTMDIYTHLFQEFQSEEMAKLDDLNKKIVA